MTRETARTDTPARPALPIACIIGYPLGHSMSPAIHNAAYEAMGLETRYEAWSTPPEDVPAAVRRLRSEAILGMNVTVPHKQAVVPLLDEVDETARAIGAVNTIARRDGRLTGYNTDKYGFVRSLREAGCAIEGMHALIIGYGGSERAVAYGLAEAGVASVALAGRRAEGVAEAAAHLRTTTPRPLSVIEVAQRELADACGRADLIVNCTPVGMRHAPDEGRSPVPASLLRAGVWVYDVVYNPLETELLRLARDAGGRPVDGLGMLVYQAAEAIRLWTGREAPVNIMRAAALEALAARG